MLTAGGTLSRHDIAAVFHGHAHKGYHEGEHNGIKVYNVAWPIFRKSGFEVPVFILEFKFNVVSSISGVLPDEAF